MTSGFWNGKRVFLTGHTGFKGAWLALWLQRMGATVHGYALAPEQPQALFNVACVAEGLIHQEADICDSDVLFGAIQKFSPDIVFHMAAQSLVRRSYREPAQTYRTNVMGTVNVLDAVRRVPGVRATIIVTSDKCYENAESGGAFVESDPMGGHDPYSSSKGCAELVTVAYANSFFESSNANGSVVSVRAGNAIGGGDWADDRILPDIFRALLAGDDVVLRSPAAIRPWQHVLEPLSGYLMVAEHLLQDSPRHWEAWNFGPDSASEQSVEVIAKTCCKLWGRPDAVYIGDAVGEPHEAGILRLNSAKARSTLGWKPRWGLNETLRYSVDWYRAFAEKADMREMTLRQIDAYLGADE